MLLNFLFLELKITNSFRIGNITCFDSGFYWFLSKRFCSGFKKEGTVPLFFFGWVGHYKFVPPVKQLRAG